ncbi:MAG: deoxyribonuclease IV [Planctomycetes bacterium]|nr:deoxyribonuclease IV [Planctomycetota bacterium]
MTEMFGSHLSIAGGLHLALREARALNLDCVQVFTKNQRQWSSPPLTGEQVREWFDVQRETGITTAVSHDSYLINLANPGAEPREKSLRLFRDELERCEALGIPYLVTHPGSHMGEGDDAGLARVVTAMDQLHADLPGLRTVTCMEVTAGQGSNLGYRFEHIKTIVDGVREPERLTVCLDTAHMIEAGYDLTSAAGMRATLDELDAVVGIRLVRAVHMNDSKTPRGSRVDRHEHIGRGHVSLEAFGVLMNDERFTNVPKILETPKDVAPDGRPWDTVNIEALRGLMMPTGGTKRKPVGVKMRKKT